MLFHLRARRIARIVEITVNDARICCLSSSFSLAILYVSLSLQARWSDLHFDCYETLWQLLQLKSSVDRRRFLRRLRRKLSSKFSFRKFVSVLRLLRSKLTFKINSDIKIYSDNSNRRVREPESVFADASVRSWPVNNCTWYETIREQRARRS